MSSFGIHIGKYLLITKLSLLLEISEKMFVFLTLYYSGPLSLSLNISRECLGKYLTARVTSGQSAGDSSGSELAKNV